MIEKPFFIFQANFIEASAIFNSGHKQVYVILLIFTMILWGSWPVLKRSASYTIDDKDFFRNFSSGVLFFSLIIALAVAIFTSDKGLIFQELIQIHPFTVLSIVLGGIICSLGNYYLLLAINQIGLSLAFPISVGIGLIIGVFYNYWTNPIGNLQTIILGISSLVLALVLSGSVVFFKINGAREKIKGRFLYSFISGLCFGLYFKLIDYGLTDNTSLTNDGKVGPVIALAIFGIGFHAGTSSLKLLEYKTGKETVRFSLWPKKPFFSPEISRGYIAGMIWIIGLFLSIISMPNVGAAISFGLSQGSVFVAAVWGVFVWKEFANYPKSVWAVLAPMFLLYLTGIALLAVSI